MKKYDFSRYVFMGGVAISIQNGGKRMRISLILIGFVIGVLFGVQACQAQPLIAGRGTVHYVDVAGGFYGIESRIPHDGSYLFDPMFMPFRFRFDGLHIWFLALMLPGWGSVHCWGESVFIIKMMRSY